MLRGSEMLFPGWNKLVRAMGPMGFSFSSWGVLQADMAVAGGMRVSYPFLLKSWPCNWGLAHARALPALSPMQLQLTRWQVLQWGASRDGTAGVLGPAMKASVGNSAPAGAGAPGFSSPNWEPVSVKHQLHQSSCHDYKFCFINIMWKCSATFFPSQ